MEITRNELSIYDGILLGTEIYNQEKAMESLIGEMENINFLSSQFNIISSSMENIKQEIDLAKILIPTLELIEHNLGIEAGYFSSESMVDNAKNLSKRIWVAMKAFLRKMKTFILKWYTKAKLKLQSNSEDVMEKINLFINTSEKIPFTVKKMYHKGIMDISFLGNIVISGIGELVLADMGNAFINNFHIPKEDRDILLRFDNKTGTFDGKKGFLSRTYTENGVLHILIATDVFYENVEPPFEIILKGEYYFIDKNKVNKPGTKNTLNSFGFNRYVFAAIKDELTDKKQVQSDIDDVFDIIKTLEEILKTQEAKVENDRQKQADFNNYITTITKFFFARVRMDIKHYGEYKKFLTMYEEQYTPEIKKIII